jgi:hypothetical protein
MPAGTADAPTTSPVAGPTTITPATVTATPHPSSEGTAGPPSTSAHSAGVRHETHQGSVGARRNQIIALLLVFVLVVRGACDCRTASEDEDVPDEEATVGEDAGST